MLNNLVAMYSPAMGQMPRKFDFISSMGSDVIHAITIISKHTCNRHLQARTLRHPTEQGPDLRCPQRRSRRMPTRTTIRARNVWCLLINTMVIRCLQ